MCNTIIVIYVLCSGEFSTDVDSNTVDFAPLQGVRVLDVSRFARTFYKSLVKW